MSKQYKDAGVNLKAGYESVELIKKHIKNTNRLGVFSNIGSFGGMFDLEPLKLKNPVLVSATDGVGTKLKLAFNLDKHDTIGQDLVAMCVNDVLAQGAAPLFFLDYIATSKVVPDKIEQIVKGIADGCILSNAALIGGETAEMPGMYGKYEYDLAGFCVGAVEKDKIIDSNNVQIGDILIGLSSSGVHSNGFSLVRKILIDNNINLDTYVDSLNTTVGKSLLTPTKIYVKPVLEVLNTIDVHGIAHITGGGFYENIPRALKDGQQARINLNTFEVLPIFKYLQTLANISTKEMFNVFNMGIGMVLIISKEDIDQTLKILENNHQTAFVIGEVTSGSGVILT